MSPSALTTWVLAIALAPLSAPGPSVAVAPANVESAREPGLSDDVSIGDPSAPVTVVEYLSTTCSHCAAFDAITFPHVEESYLKTGRVRIVIRELPTAPVIVSSAGFLLARCAGRDEYWAAVRRLLARQTYVLEGADGSEEIRRAAEVVGLPAATVTSCLTDEAALQRLNARRQRSLDEGVDATPTFEFNGRRLKPGDRLGREAYPGGELSASQFDAAFRAASPSGDSSTKKSQGVERRWHAGAPDPEARARSSKTQPFRRHHQLGLSLDHVATLTISKLRVHTNHFPGKSTPT